VGSYIVRFDKNFNVVFKKTPQDELGFSIPLSEGDMGSLYGEYQMYQPIKNVAAIKKVEQEFYNFSRTI
jgi:hypothetical protein